MEENQKRGFGTELNRCLFAIENPELTYTVSKIQTAYGIVDILMHTLERYFSESYENDLADGLAEGLIREVLKAGETVLENPRDYEKAMKEELKRVSDLVLSVVHEKEELLCIS